MRLTSRWCHDAKGEYSGNNPLLTRRGSGNVGASGMRGSTNVGSKYDSVADMEPRKAPGGGTVLLTLEKYPDGRPSLVRAGVGNIAVFGMSGSVHDRRPRNAPAGVT